MAPCCKRVPYIPSPADYKLHYRQTGGALPVFRGLPHQQGYGLGNILSLIGKTVVPIMKNVGKRFLKTGLKAGRAALSDVIEGKDIKSSLKKRALEGLKEAGKSILENEPVSRPDDDQSDWETPTPQKVHHSSQHRVVKPHHRSKKRRRAQRGAGGFFFDAL